MRKYSFLSTYIVVLIILYIGIITNTNALVGNICTSDTIKELNNVTTTGVKVKVKVKKWAPSRSKIRVKIDVGKKKSIRNLIIWAETVNGEHIGYWDPISAHVYVSGCNGPGNSTISNQVDLNLSHITYIWNPPNAKDYKTFVTPTPSITTNAVTITPTYSTKATTAPNPSTFNMKRHKQAAKSGSIKFKGVLQLMNHTDDDIYYFESNFIKKSSSNNEKVISGNNHILNVTRINDNIPKDPPFSAAYYNNYNNIINLLLLNSVIALIIEYFLYFL
ncbi:unnamed protein product [Rhizophagus irregularis]|nr:unnamed protein product [Rhizophagus irregularis]CAB5359760.1 unnamed protein product [Rhizophagus irregularis]